jgi:hypothetical protein
MSYFRLSGQYLFLRNGRKTYALEINASHWKLGFAWNFVPISFSLQMRPVGAGHGNSVFGLSGLFGLANSRIQKLYGLRVRFTLLTIY